MKILEVFAHICPYLKMLFSCIKTINWLKKNPANTLFATDQLNRPVHVGVKVLICSWCWQTDIFFFVFWIIFVEPSGRLAAPICFCHWPFGIWMHLSCKHSLLSNKISPSTLSSHSSRLKLKQNAIDKRSSRIRVQGHFFKKHKIWKTTTFN